MSIKTHLAWSPGLTPTQPQKTDTVIAERLLFFFFCCAMEIIVFTNGRRKSEAWRRCGVRSEVTAGGVNLLRGEFLWNLVKLCFLPWLKRPTPADCYHSNLRNVFLLCKNLSFQFPGTPVGLFTANERAKRRWGSYRVLCGKSTGITGIWPHSQLNYICLTSSAWLHRTGHMGITAASSESKLNLVHFNIMSKEGRLYLGMIAQLNCVSEGFCIK